MKTLERLKEIIEGSYEEQKESSVQPTENSTFFDVQGESEDEVDILFVDDKGEQEIDHDN